MNNNNTNLQQIISLTNYNANANKFKICSGAPGACGSPVE